MPQSWAQLHELPLVEKATHAEVGFESKAKYSFESCRTCVHFIRGKPHRCETVQRPVYRASWCQRHSKELPAGAPLPKKLHGNSNQWKLQLPELLAKHGPYGIEEIYYKSECRPLRELKPLHRQTRFTQKHDFLEWLEARDRARKDLYWLGKECIGTEASGANFMPHVHREMCGMFVQKNFDGVYHKNYTLDEVRKAIDRQNREKEMLLLAPRGSFKSTVNKVDCAQWMLNCPDIRILIITGAFNLADKFLKEVKGFFYKPDGIGPTYFQSLFPEYILTGQDGVSSTDLVCPARICRQEGNPSLWVNSIGGTLAGWHCDVMKGDDIVNEENSNNDVTREKLKDRYDNVSSNLPDEWAFRDQIGTRYYEDDWYGDRIADMLRYGDTNALKYLKRSAWTVKPEYASVPIKLLQEHMVDVYFPEKLSFRSLITKCRSNEKQFRCQQLNEPAASETITQFAEEVLRDHLIIQNKVPYPQKGNRRTVICWDTAHDDKDRSDYSAGAVGYCHEETRALYILEVDPGKWKDSELAVHVVDLHLKWNPLFTEIEKFAGWEMLAAEIQRIAIRRCGQNIPLTWRQTDNTLNAKANRIKGLEVLLADDRLWFADGEWIELTFQQFVKFTGVRSKRKDDIPDAISCLQRLIPRERHEQIEEPESNDARKEREARENAESFLRQRADAEYATIFQPGAPPLPEPEPVVVDEGPARIFGGIGIHL